MINIGLYKKNLQTSSSSNPKKLQEKQPTSLPVETTTKSITSLSNICYKPLSLNPISFESRRHYSSMPTHHNNMVVADACRHLNPAQNIIIFGNSSSYDRNITSFINESDCKFLFGTEHPDLEKESVQMPDTSDGAIGDIAIFKDKEGHFFIASAWKDIYINGEKVAESGDVFPLQQGDAVDIGPRDYDNGHCDYSFEFTLPTKPYKTESNQYYENIIDKISNEEIRIAAIGLNEAKELEKYCYNQLRFSRDAHQKETLKGMLSLVSKFEDTTIKNGNEKLETLSQQILNQETNVKALPFKEVQDLAVYANAKAGFYETELQNFKKKTKDQSHGKAYEEIKAEYAPMASLASFLAAYTKALSGSIVDKFLPESPLSPQKAENYAQAIAENQLSYKQVKTADYFDLMDFCKKQYLMSTAELEAVKKSDMPLNKETLEEDILNVGLYKGTYDYLKANKNDRLISDLQTQQIQLIDLDPQTYQEIKAYCEDKFIHAKADEQFIIHDQSLLQDNDKNLTDSVMTSVEYENIFESFKTFEQEWDKIQKRELTPFKRRHGEFDENNQDFILSARSTFNNLINGKLSYSDLSEEKQTSLKQYAKLFELKNKAEKLSIERSRTLSSVFNDRAIKAEINENTFKEIGDFIDQTENTLKRLKRRAPRIETPNKINVEYAQKDLNAIKEGKLRLSDISPDILTTLRAAAQEITLNRQAEMQARQKVSPNMAESPALKQLETYAPLQNLLEDYAANVAKYTLFMPEINNAGKILSHNDIPDLLSGKKPLSSIPITNLKYTLNHFSYQYTHKRAEVDTLQSNPQFQIPLEPCIKEAKQATKVCKMINTYLKALSNTFSYDPNYTAKFSVLKSPQEAEEILQKIINREKVSTLGIDDKIPDLMLYTQNKAVELASEAEALRSIPPDTMDTAKSLAELADGKAQNAELMRNLNTSLMNYRDVINKYKG